MAGFGLDADIFWCERAATPEYCARAHYRSRVGIFLVAWVGFWANFQEAKDAVLTKCEEGAEVPFLGLVRVCGRAPMNVHRHVGV